MKKITQIKSLTINEAILFQYRMVEEITKVFSGTELTSMGDLGLATGVNKPKVTKKVETVIASFFESESSVLVRGAGTAAICFGLSALVKPGDIILVHSAPIYPTTKTTIKMLGLTVVEADFNNLDELSKILKLNKKIKAVLIQHTRQKIDDNYKIKDVIKTIKNKSSVPILVDDNYAVMRAEKIGVQYSSDLSCFSTFKLLGPEGIGCIVGKKKYVDKVIENHYSGGLQTQGHEALEVLRGLIYAPVSLAIQANVCEEIIERLKTNEIPEIKWAAIANAQSKVVIIEFYEDIAEQVCETSVKFGAMPYPIGSESKYEFVPLFYRISGTFRTFDTDLEKRMIRINPMRSGTETIMRILKTTLKEIY